MAYSVEVAEILNKTFGKLAKKDKATFQAVNKKVAEIVDNPHHYKPLRAPLQNKRRVHISGSFVLIFKIDEERKVVQLLEFEDHDKAYK
ncbi:MAG TPA: type II toxin-antitoxin system RelE/ParE family toxin [Candidatus Nanoarchaeia archaeon]|nr:type II toxin-antitoxin system RelE/ParE family toxin [Candidatus Nanoarchaeia archaeon]